jgi:hypothetical protein
MEIMNIAPRNVSRNANGGESAKQRWLSVSRVLRGKFVRESRVFGAEKARM